MFRHADVDRAQLLSLFETTRQGPRIRIERSELDAQFSTALKDDKHILLYGPTRLGKTTLLKGHLGADKYCLIECQPGIKKADIYRIYLADGGLSFSVEKRTKNKLGANASVKFFVGSVGADAGRESEVLTRSISVDLGNASDVIRLCVEQSYDRFLVLNNFQQLSLNVQLDVLGDLAVFYERSSIRFIFLAITNTPDRFVSLDQRAEGKIESVYVGPFGDEESKQYFDRVASATELPIPNDVREKIAEITQGNIPLIAKLCRSYVTEFAAKGASTDGASTAFVESAAARLVSSVAAGYEKSLIDLALHRDLHVEFESQVDLGAADDAAEEPAEEESADVKIITQALDALKVLPDDAAEAERRQYVIAELEKLLEPEAPTERTLHEFLGLQILTVLLQKQPSDLAQGVAIGDIAKALQAGVFARASSLDEVKLKKLIRSIVRLQDETQPQLQVFACRPEDDKIAVTDHAFLVYLENKDRSELLDALQDAANENTYQLSNKFYRKRTRLSD